MNVGKWNEPFFSLWILNFVRSKLEHKGQVKPFVADNERRQTATSKKGCQLQAKKGSLARQHKNVIELWEAATISRKLIRNRARTHSSPAKWPGRVHVPLANQFAHCAGPLCLSLFLELDVIPNPIPNPILIPILMLNVILVLFMNTGRNEFEVEGSEHIACD